MIKVAAPRIALKVIDDAIQAHGGAGVSEDFGLARMYAHIRTLRLADGPDEVHNRSIAPSRIRALHQCPGGDMSGPDAFSGVKPVEPRHRIDEARLAAWLAEHVRDYAGPA